VRGEKEHNKKKKKVGTVVLDRRFQPVSAKKKGEEINGLRSRLRATADDKGNKLGGAERFKNPRPQRERGTVKGPVDHGSANTKLWPEQELVKKQVPIRHESLEGR